MFTVTTTNYFAGCENISQTKTWSRIHRREIRCTMAIKKLYYSFKNVTLKSILSNRTS